MSSSTAIFKDSKTRDSTTHFQLACLQHGVLLARDVSEARFTDSKKDTYASACALSGAAGSLHGQSQCVTSAAERAECECASDQRPASTLRMTSAQLREETPGIPGYGMRG